MKPLSGLGLDFKLGWRVMARQPGPTVLAVMAMAVAVGICTAGFELVTQLRRPELGFEEGERLVAIRIWDRERAQLRLPTRDEFLVWRDELESVQQVSGFRNVERNLVLTGGSAGTISVAQISSSGMALTGVTPASLRRLAACLERRMSSQVRPAWRWSGTTCGGQCSGRPQTSSGAQFRSGVRKSR